ncbi:MAG: YbaB/EbfC family nucleoid-associated protein [Clostridiales bacterium]
MGNRFGGFGGGGGGGGMGNMQNLMKQAQQMQQKMQDAQAELEEMELVGVAGNGLVEVTVNGKKALLSVKLDPKVVDPEDVEMLEDLLVVAFNDAQAKVDAASEELMGPLAGGMGGLL